MDMEAVFISKAKTKMIKKFLVISKLSIENIVSGMIGRITSRIKRTDITEGKANTKADLIFKFLNL